MRRLEKGFSFTKRKKLEKIKPHEVGLAFVDLVLHASQFPNPNFRAEKKRREENHVRCLAFQTSWTINLHFLSRKFVKSSKLETEVTSHFQIKSHNESWMIKYYTTVVV